MIKKLQTALHHLEDGILASILLTMILMAGTQIVLRNVFDSGIIWIDPMLKSMVLWLGLLGALAASRDRKHITVDVLARVLPPRLQTVANIIASAFTVAVSGTIAYHAVRLVHTEIEYPSKAFAGVYSWQVELVIPIAFGLIAVRYGLYMLEQIISFFKGVDHAA